MRNNYETLPQVTSNPALFQGQAVTSPSVFNPSPAAPVDWSSSVSSSGSGIGSLLSGLLGPIGSAVGAGAGLLNSAFERKWQADQAELNRQFQSAEADKARNWNEEMWNKNNEYNTPAAQLQRLLDAGLNPSTAVVSMLGGQAGNSAAPSTAQAAPAGAQASHPGSISGSLMDLIGGTSKSVFENMIMNEDILSKKGQNEILQATIPNLIQLSRLNTQEASKRIDQMIANTQSVQEQTRLTRLQQAAQTLSNANYQRVVDWEIKLKKANYDLTKMDITKRDWETQLIMAQKGLIPYQAAVLNSQKFLNNEMAIHAGDESIDQWLVGILDDSELRDKLINFVNAVINPQKGKSNPKLSEPMQKRMNKATEDYNSGKISAEEYSQQMSRLAADITEQNDLQSQVPKRPTTSVLP